ncbi:MAG: hypothetical protein ACPG5B_15525 [Chitinophagales bacterium]
MKRLLFSLAFFLCITLFFSKNLTAQNEAHIADLATKKNVSGFTNLTEIGMVLGKNDLGQQAGFSLQNTTSYQIVPLLAVGLGIGYTDLGTRTITQNWVIHTNIPIKTFALFGDIRGDVFKNTLATPFYFASLGYAFTAAENLNEDIDQTQKGGLMMNFGGGLKVKTLSKRTFTIAAGYLSQKMTYTEFWETSDLEKNLTFKRLSVRAGMSF